MGIRANRLRGLFYFALIVWPFEASLCFAAGFEAELQLTGGAHRMFRQGLDKPVLEINAWSTDSQPHDVLISFNIEDAFNRVESAPLKQAAIHLPADGTHLGTRIPLDSGIGYHTAFITLDDGAATITRSIDLGIVWPPYPGTRPNSFFATQRIASARRRPATSRDHRNESATGTFFSDRGDQQHKLAKRNAGRPGRTAGLR